MHVLEAGYEVKGRRCVLLLHGFPELAYSWRKVMLPLAEAGFHVIAPDQRGYGRTVGWDGDYDGDLGSFRLLNLVRDALGLVSALLCALVAFLTLGFDAASPGCFADRSPQETEKKGTLSDALFAGWLKIELTAIAVAAALARNHRKHLKGHGC
jgi:hypothetical protein